MLEPAPEAPEACELHEKPFDRWVCMVEAASQIDPGLYHEYEVKRGLRDVSGKGVLAGLTQIGNVVGSEASADALIPAPGRLSYRGIEITDLVEGFTAAGRFGFEETAYLLLMGELPKAEELDEFQRKLARHRDLPRNFVNDAILRLPSQDSMNELARSVLALYVLDKNPDEVSVRNVLWQSLQLISSFPVLAVYGYQAYMHNYYQNRSLYIHAPEPELSTAENILHMLRADSQYTELEAKVLDLTLVLQAEHGGGNNSSFTTHVVSSTGTDTYAAVAASLGSLKGPRHGGANIKVARMFEDMKNQLSSWDDEAAIEAYLKRLLDKDAFDKAGLIYGLGHPVYSISDPRTLVLRQYAEMLAEEKGRTDEYLLHRRVEELGPQAVADKRKVYKGVSANVDFYSGFVYQMLGIPEELFTPLFAVSRVVGWCAHRLEEIVSGGKIIRPAYKSVAPTREYTPLDER
jgi:citrate synthase